MSQLDVNKVVAMTRAALTGKWENELGSRVHFLAHPDGILTGDYFTGVGNAKCNKLTGR